MNHHQRMKYVLCDIIASGGLDLDATLNIREVLIACDRYMANDVHSGLLKQAARNVLRKRESHGKMIWEIDIERFVYEHMKLAGHADTDE